MIYIGIDPGSSGGIAWFLNGKLCVEKMPDTLADLWDLLFVGIACQSGDYGKKPAAECIVAYIEQVHSSPQMGVKSAFTFGQGFGHLEMALTAAKIPFHRVRPQEWQKAMKCLTKGDKNVSKRRAQELFPEIKFTHATADAALIAAYGRTKNL